MSLHSDTLFWFRANQSLLFLLNADHRRRSNKYISYSLWLDPIALWSLFAIRVYHDTHCYVHKHWCLSFAHSLKSRYITTQIGRHKNGCLSFGHYFESSYITTPIGRQKHGCLRFSHYLQAWCITTAIGRHSHVTCLSFYHYFISWYITIAIGRHKHGMVDAWILILFATAASHSILWFQ